MSGVALHGLTRARKAFSCRDPAGNGHSKRDHGIDMQKNVLGRRGRAKMEAGVWNDRPSRSPFPTPQWSQHQRTQKPWSTSLDKCFRNPWRSGFHISKRGRCHRIVCFFFRCPMAASGPAKFCADAVLIPATKVSVAPGPPGRENLRNV